MIEVLVVDDDPLVRAGLSMILGGGGDIQVVAEAGSGTDVAAAVAEHRPDVVLMDIRMPGMDGIAATEALLRRPDPPVVIMLTTFDTDDHVVRAMRAGASGFLLKHTPPPELVRAVRCAAGGEPIVSPGVLRKLMGYAADAGADPRRQRARERLARLSSSERRTAELVAQGLTNSQISQEMYVSIATVKAYVSRVLAKLELGNRVQIALLVHDAELDQDSPPPRRGPSSL